MTGKERERRLVALEAVAAKRAEAADRTSWSRFTTAHLRELVAVTRDLEAGTLTGTEADQRLAAVPGLPEALEHSLAAWLAAHPPEGRT
jgi:hypothetical protein